MTSGQYIQLPNYNQTYNHNHTKPYHLLDTLTFTPLEPEAYSLAPARALNIIHKNIQYFLIDFTICILIVNTQKHIWMMFIHSSAVQILTWCHKN